MGFDDIHPRQNHHHSRAKLDPNKAFSACKVVTRTSCAPTVRISNKFLRKPAASYNYESPTSGPKHQVMNMVYKDRGPNYHATHMPSEYRCFDHVVNQIGGEMTDSRVAESISETCTQWVMVGSSYSRSCQLCEHQVILLGSI